LEVVDSDAVNVVLVYVVVCLKRLSNTVVRLDERLSFSILSCNSFFFGDHIVVFNQLWALTPWTVRTEPTFGAPAEVLPDFKLNERQKKDSKEEVANEDHCIAF